MKKKQWIKSSWLGQCNFWYSFLQKGKREKKNNEKQIIQTAGLLFTSGMSTASTSLFGDVGGSDFFFTHGDREDRD